MIQQFVNIHVRKFASEDVALVVLEDLLDRLDGLAGRVFPGDMVLIKPNFVAPYKHATTDLKFIDFFITKIRQAGAIPIIGEASGCEFDTEATFDILGIRKFARDRDVELINFEKATYSRVNLGNGLGTIEIANAALEAKLIINLPVLKEHRITRVTGAVKNLFSFLSKPSRRYIHIHGLEKGIAALTRMFENAIHFVDARYRLTSAVFGELSPLGYYLAGLDPFALDHFGSKLLGVNPEKVKHLEGTGGYRIEGHVPDKFSVLSNKSSLNKWFQRMLYSLFFRLDDIKCSTLGGESLAPYMQWTFGIHPVIENVDPEELKLLVLLCPVGAISVEKKKIIKEKCFRVRCLKCYFETRSGTIALKGLNPYRRKL